MANEPTTQEKSKKQGGFFESMSAVQKVLLIIFGVAIFFLIWNFAFGGIQTIYELVMFGASFVGIGVLFWVVLNAISWYLAPEHFSPKKDYFTRVVNLSIDLKPKNVGDLYFIGDELKRRVKAGSIVGLLGIPYLVGKPKIHSKDIVKEGKVVAKKGSAVFLYSNNLKKAIPVFDKIEYGKDGDTLIVYEVGWLIKRRHYLRCHRTLHSDLNGDVDVYDINPVPYGTLFEYPFKQIQASAPRIMIQNQLEIILSTHEHQYDLISQGVDSAVYFNPYFRLLQKQNAEVVATE